MSETLTNPADQRATIARLLNRYPDLTRDETDTLLAFFATGPLVERGMLRGDAALSPIIEQLERDHPARFRAGASQSLFVAVLLLAPIALFWWAAVRWGG